MKISFLVYLSLNLLVVDSVSRKNARHCSTTRFRFNKSHPMLPESVIKGEAPMEFHKGCPETQHCLLFKDDTFANLLASSIGTAFPIFGNEAIKDIDPSIPDILSNSQKVTDDGSVLVIEGIGTYTTPSGIASYRAFPKAVNVRAWVNETAFVYHPSFSRLELNALVYELFPFMSQPAESHWKKEYLFYPCSMIQKLEVLQLPVTTLNRFKTLVEAPNSTRDMCEHISNHCTGSHQQYDNVTDCMSYMDSLPTTDPLCEYKFSSPAAAQGESKLCKYLHHGMAEFEPEPHCYHAGGEGRYDASGKRKCVPSDCVEPTSPQTLLDAMKNYSYSRALNLSDTNIEKVEECTSKEREEIATATILALGYCLPSLSLGKCSTNCSQAVTTFLGRFAGNGGLCRCDRKLGHIEDNSPSPSAILAHMDVDAATLLSFCYDETPILHFPDCLSLELSTCSSPRHYVARHGCKLFDFDTIEALIRWEWGSRARVYGRHTQSDLIASAECQLFINWYSNERNVEKSHVFGYLTGILEGAAASDDFNDGKNPDSLSSKRTNSGSINEDEVHGNAISDLYIHPSLGKLDFQHKDVVQMLQEAPERNSHSVNHYFGCYYEFDEETLRNKYAPQTLSSSHETHAAARTLINKTFQGLFTDFAQNYAFHLVDNNQEINEDYSSFDLNVVGKKIAFSMIRALFSNKSSNAYARKLNIIDPFREDVEDYFNVMTAYFMPKIYSRLYGGNMIAVAHFSKKYQFRRMVKEVIPPEEMIKYVQDFSAQSGASLSLEEAYDFVATVQANAAAIPYVAMDIIYRMRKGYCGLIEKWNDNPKSFIMEHLRLQPPAPIVASGSKKQKQLHLSSLAIANVDPQVFTNPLEFVPNRHDLKNMVTFNQLEADFQSGDPRTRTRGCPAQAFSVEFLKDTLPKFFPKDVKCSSGIRSMEGVKFESELMKINVDGNQDEVILEVYKSPSSSFGLGPQDNGKSNLLILLHDFPLLPTSFSKLIAKIRENSLEIFDTHLSFWAPVLPGWGKGTQLSSCDFRRTGEIIAKLCDSASRDENKRIYLVGHGLGGLVAWHAAHLTGKGVIEGLITFAPHPLAHTLFNVKRPIQSTKFFPFLNPVISGPYLPVDDYRILRDLLKNQSWWGENWKYELLRHWDLTGSKALTCYYRDNYKGDSKFLPNDLDQIKSVDPSVNILMIASGHDDWYSLSEYEDSFLHVSQKIGKLFILHNVRSASHYGIILEDEHVDITASKIVNFLRRIRYGRLSVWSTFYTSPEIGEEPREDGDGNPRFFMASMLSVVVFLTGIALEIGIGPYLLRSDFKEKLWIFAQVLSGPVAIACFASKSFVSIPLWIISVFKMGFPQIVTALTTPIYHPSMIVYYI